MKAEGKKGAVKFRFLWDNNGAGFTGFEVGNFLVVESKLPWPWVRRKSHCVSLRHKPLLRRKRARNQMFGSFKLMCNDILLNSGCICVKLT